jgi:NADH:ubiquinone oxidoreductase subunit
MQHNKEGQGFLTFALNTDEVDYIRLAYLQALNVKATQKDAKYAVIVNDASKIPQHYRKVFDHVGCIGAQGFDAEPYAMDLSPFKETIKLEADLLFTRSIDHWWTAFRLKDVCLSYNAKNFKGFNSSIIRYREMFEANNLPNVYNGLMYFRYSRPATEFFNAAKFISREWEGVKNVLQKCVEDRPSTDVLYALTAMMIGEETVTIPSMDFINFVHMKSGFNGWSDNRSWVDTVMNERDGDVVRINNLNQYFPVHYYDKNYATDELIGYYEQRVLG